MQRTAAPAGLARRRHSGGGGAIEVALVRRTREYSMRDLSKAEVARAVVRSLNLSLDQLPLKVQARLASARALALEARRQTLTTTGESLVGQLTHQPGGTDQDRDVP
jgi:hypothetical protein